MSEVKLKFLRFGLRPPPFIDLLFQADVVNTEARPLWLLFPLYLDQPPEPQPLLASSAEIFELRGKGQLRIARFMGNGSFQATRLSPNARVRVREFPITLIGEPPTQITLPVMLAEQLKIGDQGAENWLPIDLTSSREADVTEEPGAIVATKETPGAQPVPVTPSGTRTLSLRVPLGKR